MEQYIAQQILKVRDALIAHNRDEAYHQLYKLANPDFDSPTPWASIELAAATPSPAKAEQEAVLQVYDLSGLSEEGKRAFASDVMVSATKSLIATFYSLRLESHLDQISINDANGDRFILAFRKIVDDKLLGPTLPMFEIPVPKAEQEGLRWVQGEYEKLYQQVKSGKRSVCYVDYQFSGEIIARDICTIRNDDRMELGARGIGYGSIWHNASGSQLEEFIKVCESLNVEWLESTTPPVKEDFEKKYKEANQFIIDLAKELGQEGLGYDDLSWTIEDFIEAAKTKFGAAVKEAGQLTVATIPNFDELWDEFSEDSTLTEGQYDKLVAKFKFLLSR